MGYRNARDENNKPTIIIDEKTAPFVQIVFSEISSGLFTQEEIRLKYNQKGLRFTKSDLSLLPRNKFYIVILRLLPYKDEPESFYTGVHEPIISKQLFL